jgi:hypothetical protein
MELLIVWRGLEKYSAGGTHGNRHVIKLTLLQHSYTYADLVVAILKNPSLH